MLGVFVGEGELAKVAADHVELDLDDVESFAVVNSDVAAHHVGHYDGISQVCLDGHWLFSGRSVLLGLFAFHVQPVVFMLDF